MAPTTRLLGLLRLLVTSRSCVAPRMSFPPAFSRVHQKWTVSRPYFPGYKPAVFHECFSLSHTQDQYIEPAWTLFMPAVNFFEARSGSPPLLVQSQEESHARGRFVVVQIYRSLTDRLCRDRGLTVDGFIVDWQFMTQRCAITAIACFQAVRLLSNWSLAGYFAIMRSVF